MPCSIGGGAAGSVNPSASCDVCANIANAGNGTVGVWVNGTIQGAGNSSNGVLNVTYNGQDGALTSGTYDSSSGTFSDGFGNVTFNQSDYSGSNAATFADALNATSIQSVANPCSIVAFYAASAVVGTARICRGKLYVDSNRFI
jgi:hypothetical protein